MKYQKYNSRLSPLIGALLMTGCQSFVEAGQPLPPSELLWIKYGISSEVRESEIKQCGELNRKAYEAAIAAKTDLRTDIFDLCMLRKGFKYNPQPKMLPHWQNEKGNYISGLHEKPLNKCAKETFGGTLSIEEFYINLDALKLCMKNDGYTYFAGKGTWRNICAMSTFENRIACQSTRWGFTLPPEK